MRAGTWNSEPRVTSRWTVVTSCGIARHLVLATLNGRVLNSTHQKAASSLQKSRSKEGEGLWWKWGGSLRHKKWTHRFFERERGYPAREEEYRGPQAPPSTACLSDDVIPAFWDGRGLCLSF